MIRKHFIESKLNHWGAIHYLTIAAIKDSDSLAVWALAQAVPSLSIDSIKNHLSMSDGRFFDAISKLESLGLIEYKVVFENGYKVEESWTVSHSASIEVLGGFLHE